MLQAGLWNAVSVPDGAPAQARKESDPLPPAGQDKKFSYLDTCAPLFKSARAREVRRV